jgi:hypothetical protein
MDEVGIQLSDMHITFATTRSTIRANLENDHITAMLTTNTLGNQLPVGLIYLGSNLGVIPSCAPNDENI